MIQSLPEKEKCLRAVPERAQGSKEITHPVRTTAILVESADARNTAASTGLQFVGGWYAMGSKSVRCGAAGLVT